MFIQDTQRYTISFDVYTLLILSYQYLGRIQECKADVIYSLKDMEHQELDWIRKNVCHPHGIYSGKQVGSTMKVIQRHYKQKHRIVDPYSTVCKMKEIREKRKKRSAQHGNNNNKNINQDESQNNHNTISIKTGGLLIDGTRWGDALYIKQGKCSACTKDTSHRCQQDGCTITICNMCYGWCQDITELRCWHHLSEEKKQHLSKQQERNDYSDDDSKMDLLPQDPPEQDSLDDVFNETLIQDLESWDQAQQMTEQQVQALNELNFEFILSVVQEYLEEPIGDYWKQDDNDDVQMIDTCSQFDNLECCDDFSQHDSDDNIVGQMDTPGFVPTNDTDFVNNKPTKHRRSNRIRNKQQVSYTGCFNSTDISNDASSEQDYQPHDSNIHETDATTHDDPDHDEPSDSNQQHLADIHHFIRQIDDTNYDSNHNEPRRSQRIQTQPLVQYCESPDDNHNILPTSSQDEYQPTDNDTEMLPLQLSHQQQQSNHDDDAPIVQQHEFDNNDEDPSTNDIAIIQHSSQQNRDAISHDQDESSSEDLEIIENPSHSNHDSNHNQHSRPDNSDQSSSEDLEIIENPSQSNLGSSRSIAPLRQSTRLRNQGSVHYEQFYPSDQSTGQLSISTSRTQQPSRDQQAAFCQDISGQSSTQSDTDMSSR